ncbi:MAG: hypothetical protein KY443_02325 [Actinobacteria bacterium]|nr:hypothetical protein [Actinomycetota bacterium]
MSEIAVTAMEPGHFGVQVTEGHQTNSVRVAVPAALVDDLALVDVPGERIVEETIAFLLERQPAMALQGELDLDDVGRRFPEYYDELRARLAA